MEPAVGGRPMGWQEEGRQVYDHIADTPPAATPYCPGCEPDRDPRAEALETRYCETHLPPRTGTEDAKVGDAAYISSGESGGEDNRKFCDLVHRSKPKEDTQ